MCRVAFVLFVLFMSRAPAETGTLLPDAGDSPGLGVVAGEVGGALFAGGVLGLGLGYAANRAAGGSSDLLKGPIVPILAGFGGAVLGDAAGSALGTWLVGSIAQQDHAGSGAVIGAAIGLPVGLVLAAVAGAMESNGKPGTLLLIPAVAAPMVGAVIGYNRAPPCGCTGESVHRFGSRMLPPSIGLAREPGVATVVAYDVRLLNVRF